MVTSGFEEREEVSVLQKKNARTRYDRTGIMDIGFIGLGTMGSRVAGKLVKASGGELLA
jgi:hypothetical protein